MEITDTIFSFRTYQFCLWHKTTQNGPSQLWRLSHYLGTTVSSQLIVLISKGFFDLKNSIQSHFSWWQSEYILRTLCILLAQHFILYCLIGQLLVTYHSNFIKINKWKIQFLSWTSHILSPPKPCVTSSVWGHINMVFPSLQKILLDSAL